ncbi:MAG: HigA family addiction module antitoxin [Myxococcaceae bacterium]
MEMTQAALAEKSGLSIQTINLIINAKRAVTADTAIRLGEVFKTSPEFWMNAQASVDLWDALELRKAERTGPHVPARSARSSRRPELG